MDFSTFYESFKDRARSQDLAFLKETIAEDLIAREIRDGEVVDYGYEESIEGWKQAFDHFENMDMTWVYTDHSMTQTKDKEWIVSFWVSIVLDGEPIPNSNLFFDTFQQTDEGWKLIRSYIESGVQNPHLVKNSN